MDMSPPGTTERTSRGQAAFLPECKSGFSLMGASEPIKFHSEGRPGVWLDDVLRGRGKIKMPDTLHNALMESGQTMLCWRLQVIVTPFFTGFGALTGLQWPGYDHLGMEVMEDSRPHTRLELLKITANLVRQFMETAMVRRLCFPPAILADLHCRK